MMPCPLASGDEDIGEEDLGGEAARPVPTRTPLRPMAAPMAIGGSRPRAGGCASQSAAEEPPGGPGASGFAQEEAPLAEAEHPRICVPAPLIARSEARQLPRAGGPPAEQPPRGGGSEAEQPPRASGSAAEEQAAVRGPFTFPTVAGASESEPFCINWVWPVLATEMQAALRQIGATLLCEFSTSSSRDVYIFPRDSRWRFTEECAIAAPPEDWHQFSSASFYVVANAHVFDNLDPLEVKDGPDGSWTIARLTLKNPLPNRESGYSFRTLHLLAAVCRTDTLESVRSFGRTMASTAFFWHARVVLLKWERLHADVPALAGELCFSEHWFATSGGAPSSQVWVERDAERLADERCSCASVWILGPHTGARGAGLQLVTLPTPPQVSERNAPAEQASWHISPVRGGDPDALPPVRSSTRGARSQLGRGGVAALFFGHTQSKRRKAEKAEKYWSDQWPKRSRV